ncbi:MAG: hypothetical protein M3440_06435 [Chloroflexota bacterium]|nr:hypothetical protein [Chloroflexota bacterium]
MNLTITRNRALAVAQSSNPTSMDLGNRLCKYLDHCGEVESLLLNDNDAETAAGALMGTDLLTERERDDYMASAYV